jgi:pimeloyl-ACP methyl ester carboxylesterase
MTSIHKGFVQVPHGQVHFRYGGSGPIVVMLHGSPRSSVVHAPDIAWLGEHFTVVALDTPGCGNSSPLPPEAASIPGFARALAETLTALGIGRCAVYGTRSGAKVALQFAIDHPEQAALTLLDGLSLLPAPASEEVLQRHLDPIEPTTDGAHLARHWSRILDIHRYFPWFERTPEARLSLALPGDANLHEFATDVFMSGGRWTDAYGAALRHEAAPQVSLLRSPTVFMCREDDLLYPSLDRLPQPLPARCSIERIAPRQSSWRTRLLELLRRADLPRQAWSPPRPPVDAGAPGERDRYVDLVHGQLRVRLAGRAGTATPLLLLNDAPGGSSATRRLARSMASDRLTICPDLPGLGESHPLPYPTLGSFVTALHELLEQLEVPVVDVAAAGLGCCFAVALAAHQSKHVRRLALDGIPMIRSRDRRRVARQYCPPIEPDRSGSQLHRAWHLLRDAESSWPWYDRSAAAARVREPVLDACGLQDDLVEVVKHLPSYGEAASAAIDASVRDILKAVRQPVLLFEVPVDVRYAGTARAAQRLASARALPRPSRTDDRADALRAFFA